MARFTFGLHARNSRLLPAPTNEHVQRREDDLFHCQTVIRRRLSND